MTIAKEAKESRWGMMEGMVGMAIKYALEN